MSELSEDEAENFSAHITQSNQGAYIKIETLRGFHHSRFIERGLWKCNTGQNYCSMVV